ncbi:MAG: flagellar hook-basal body protein [bacterium]|nr:flagellar hook-basal body protein [bacterium]
MLKGLRSAETAMNIQLTRTNVLANNLANVNATGFKQVLTQIVEQMRQESDGGAATTDAAMPDAAAAAEGAAPAAAAGRGRSIRDLVLDVRAPVDMSQGTLRETGRPTDLAFQDEGLFRVVRDGQEYFTRNGAFALDAQRRLSTPDGALVQGEGGPLEIPEGELSVGADGGVRVGGVEVGRLSVVAFDDPGRLHHVGGSLLAAPAGVTAKPLAADKVRLVQGMLEESNANPIDTMVAMIAAQRAFEMDAKVLQESDRTLDKAVNQLSRTA